MRNGLDVGAALEITLSADGLARRKLLTGDGIRGLPAVGGIDLLQLQQLQQPQPSPQPMREPRQ